MAASFGGGSPLVDGFSVPSIFFAARKSNSKPMLAVNAHQNRFVRIIRFSIQFWQAKTKFVYPHTAARGPFFLLFFPSAAAFRGLSLGLFQKLFFPSIYLWFFCQTSTFCTNRAHKLCVSSQGFFSFCIQSRFSGIPELYKLFACFIIYFSFFTVFNCLLYLQNFPSVSWRIMNKVLI